MEGRKVPDERNSWGTQEDTVTPCSPIVGLISPLHRPQEIDPQPEKDILVLLYTRGGVCRTFLDTPSVSRAKPDGGGQEKGYFQEVLGILNTNSITQLSPLAEVLAIRLVQTSRPKLPAAGLKKSAIRLQVRVPSRARGPDSHFCATESLNLQSCRVSLHLTYFSTTTRARYSAEH